MFYRCPIWLSTAEFVYPTGGVLPTDLGKSGAAIEMAIREARQTILPNVFIHYDIISRKGMTGCSDEENHATYLVTNYAYEKAGKRGIPPVGLLVGPACTGTSVISVLRLITNFVLLSDRKQPELASMFYNYLVLPIESNR